MSIQILERFGNVAQDPNDAYEAYATVRDELFKPYLDRLRASDHTEDDSVFPILSIAQALASIRQGNMPKRGAVVQIRPGIFGGIDLMAVEHVTEREAVIVPAPRDSINRLTDSFQAPGALVLTDDEENMKIIGLVDNPNRALWRPDIWSPMGGMSLREFGIDSPRFKVVREESGLLVGRTPMSLPQTFGAQ